MTQPDHHQSSIRRPPATYAKCRCNDERCEHLFEHNEAEVRHGLTCPQCGAVASRVQNLKPILRDGGALWPGEAAMRLQDMTWNEFESCWPAMVADLAVMNEGGTVRELMGVACVIRERYRNECEVRLF